MINSFLVGIKIAISYKLTIKIHSFLNQICTNMRNNTSILLTHLHFFNTRLLLKTSKIGIGFEVVDLGDIAIIAALLLLSLFIAATIPSPTTAPFGSSNFLGDLLLLLLLLLSVRVKGKDLYTIFSCFLFFQPF